MLNVAIVEDNAQDAARLKKCLAEFSQESSVEFNIAEYRDPISFLEKYPANKDIVFMDIELPEMDGMKASKLLRQMDENVILIFVTNMVQFAVDGYEVDAFDFVVKPIRYPEFRMKLRRAVERIAKRTDLRLCVKTSQGVYNLGASSVRYIEVLNHSLLYHTESGDVEAYGKLDDMEKQLKGYGFFRCNRCYLVNMKYVTAIEDDAVLVGGKSLRIARPRKKEFLIAFADFFGSGGGGR